MSLDTACRAIDHLAQSSRYKDDVGIAFYGGEPLIRFPFIQSCVQYARKMLRKKHLKFSVTANSTLLTPDIAKYFVQEDFGVHVSLDGPENIHDQYRKDVHGIGSFQRTISGLKMLYDAYGDQKHNITLSMVYTPPFSEEKVSRVAELWDEFSWLPRDMSLSITYAQGLFPLLKDMQNQNKIDFSLFNWARNRYVEAFQNGISAHPIAYNLIEKELANLYQRQTMTAPRGKYHLNGCCLPAVRKLFVSVNGTYLLCERMGVAPKIGNVFTGIDVECVNKIYVKEYEKESLPFCSECWALQICKICYVHAFNNGQIDLRRKNEYCLGQRQMTLEYLRLYCSLLEINESGLEHLKNWRFL